MPYVNPDPKFLARLQKRYRKARKKEQPAILDEFVATTGYLRHHAAALLAGRPQSRDPNQPLPSRSSMDEGCSHHTIPLGIEERSAGRPS